MNIKQALTYAASKFQNIDIISYHLDSRVLLKYITGNSLEYLLSDGEKELTTQQQNKLESCINRRLNFEPIAYIVGYKEFYGHEFIVDCNTLIPRGDTELLVDAALQQINSNSTILELGVGSGAVAISLLLERSNIYITATDISYEAINIVKANAKRFCVTDRIKIIQSNWFESLPVEKFDIIISNPPYIAIEEISHMSAETITHEPRLALFAEKDGLQSYYSITLSAQKFLKPNGKILVEVGFKQATAVSEIFSQEGYKVSQVYKDLAGYDRVLLIQNQNKHYA